MNYDQIKVVAHWASKPISKGQLFSCDIYVVKIYCQLQLKHNIACHCLMRRAHREGPKSFKGINLRRVFLRSLRTPISPLTSPLGTPHWAFETQKVTDHHLAAKIEICTKCPTLIT